MDCYSTYSVAKDFAGPFATAVAAGVAVFVTWRLGSRQAKIAQQQADLAGEKLRHDLYNRRFEIFTSFFDYHDAISSWKEAPTPDQQAARQRFFRASEEAVFLFPKDSGIPDLLKKLNAEGNKVIGYKEHPETYRGDPPRMIEQQEKVSNIKLKVFEQSLEQLRAAMHPYLDFFKI